MPSYISPKPGNILHLEGTSFVRIEEVLSGPYLGGFEVAEVWAGKRYLCRWAYREDVAMGEGEHWYGRPTP